MVDKTSLDREKARKCLRALCMQIERHDYLYYRANRPEISDFEYDCLQAEKQALLKLYPEWRQNESPGSDLGNLHFPTAKHLLPMLSLSNTYSQEALFEFFRRVEGKVQAPCSYLLEPKIDGVAISLVYKRRHLEKAITRGNGYVGEVVTENVRTIKEIPSTLPENAPEEIELRGEIYLTEKQFTHLNDEQERLGLETYANARNLAAGSLKLLDVNEVAKRQLHFIAHGVGFVSNDINLDTQARLYTFFKQWGIPIFSFVVPGSGAEQIWNLIARFRLTQGELPYGTDGVVIKVNDRLLQEKLGVTAKSPRWAIAYKFEPESAETLLQEVTFQVGRTGVITPVAELIPVDLAGSKVARATLHNFDEIQRKDIRKRDTVIVQKAGEIIPAIVGVKKDKRGASAEKIEVPLQCPACGAPLLKITGEVVIRCTSLNCPPQLRLKIVHFASKDAMDMDGLGPKIVDILVSQGWLKDVADIFTLIDYRDVWVRLPGFSVTSVDNVLLAIEGAKNRPLECLLYGLSIPHVGVELARKLAEHSTSLEQLMQLSVQQLKEIPLVGEITACSIVDFFTNARNQSVIEKLLRLGLKTSFLEKPTRHPLNGKTFVLTGSLTRWTRFEVEHVIASFGGNVDRMVTKQTSILVCGANPGNKLAKAKALGIQIWSEEEFLHHIGVLHADRG
ncbi:MAG: NAD-dependent DNA ligase LigA [Puniceicoccales bacterium]|jgi:DNA ligase (NAD+)|nr:NAD-dependent DNA ligase LigA [Puniceicoccales bacterium]